MIECMTECEKCIHKAVCRYKEDYTNKIVGKVKSGDVSLLKELQNLDVKIECLYYITEAYFKTKHKDK